MPRTLSVTPCEPALMKRPALTPRFPAGTQFHVYLESGYLLVEQKERYLYTLKRGERTYPESPVFLPSRGFRSFQDLVASLPAETPIRIEAPADEAKKVIAVGNAYGSWINENVLKPTRV